MGRNLGILLLLAAVVGLPFVFQRTDEVELQGEHTLVVVSPHNESIRYEFGRGFRDWYREKTGKDVAIDWRVLGGTNEIARYLQGEYTAAFKNFWEKVLKKEWSHNVRMSFGNRRITLDDSPADDTESERARRAFLQSEIGCGIDVFFGGGTYEHQVQAEIGNTVPNDLLLTHPEWFGEEGGIPQTLSGETYWDGQGRWLGAALTSYGMIYNRDSLNRLGLESEPQHWWDLTDPRLFGEVAVCDPTKSGSITQAFEMIVQQQMQLEHGRLLQAGASPEEAETLALANGWAKAMRLIRRIAGNARYFTDTSMKPSIDVALGQSAVGMTIDFYGRFQAETVRNRSGSQRLGFTIPLGGSTISADPVSVLRGAPNDPLAEAFIEFILSETGQKLWSFKVSDVVAGAPRRYTLRRTAIRRDFYSKDNLPHFSDPDFLPYERADTFNYRREWTGPLFSEIRFLIRVMCLDTHDELKAAWKALIEADFPQEAVERFDDVSEVSYEKVTRDYATVIGSGDAVAEVELARELGAVFRKQYREVAHQARQSGIKN